MRTSSFEIFYNIYCGQFEVAKGALTSWLETRDATFHDWYCDPGYRRKGLATKILNKLLKDVPKTYLIVIYAEPTGRAFWRSKVKQLRKQGYKVHYGHCEQLTKDRE